MSCIGAFPCSRAARRASSARGLRICVERLEPRLLLATHTVLDEFNSASFSENDGTDDWAASFSELGESDGPSAGAVQITGGSLQLGGLIASLAGKGVSREADLSTATAATLTYSYKRTGSVVLSASVKVAVSNNGGSTWTNLATYTLNGSDSSFISQSFNIASYMSADTEVRVRGTGTLSVVGTFQLDNLEITYTANYPPTVATAASATPSPVAGTSTSLSVLGADDGGESNLTYTWAATSSPAGSDPIFSINGTNASKDSLVTFNQSGSYTFTATITDAGGLFTTSSVGVTVDQTLTTISVTPATATLNENSEQAFAAIGYDQFGIALTSQPTFTWSLASGVGSVDASGLYTAPGFTGTATVQAASGSVNGSASVNVNNAVPTVATAAAATPSPVTGTSTSLSVLGADDGGESNLTYTWVATSSPTGSNPIFSVNGTNASKDSLVTFDQSGSYIFTVTLTDAGGLFTTSSVSVMVDQTLSSIVVTPATASLNENETQQFSATAYDQFGLVMAIQPTFAWSIATGIGSVNGSGLYTSPASAGSATVQAASGSVTKTAAITVTNATPTVATAAAATPSTVTGVTTDLTVLGADDGGEANLTYTWAASSSPAGSDPIFSVNSTNAAKNSTVTFDAAGSYTFTVTISDGNSSVTSSANVTVDQTLTTVSVSPSSSTLNENDTQQFGATGYDQFGVALASQPTFTWSLASGVGAVDASGLYTAPGFTGTATVQAASGSVSGSASVNVNNAVPTVATAASATPSPVTSTTTTLSVLGADDGGESNLTYTWAATSSPAGSNPIFSVNGTNAAKNSDVTFNRAGDYIFTVTITDAGGLFTTSSVSITVDQTLSTISVTPSTTSLNENMTQPFSAVGYDQFAQAMAIQPSFTWTLIGGIGSVDASGDYTAPGFTGTATVQAASGSVSGSASVSVNNAVPTVAIAASATPSPVTGTSTSLSVLGADDGGESNLTYTWVATSSPTGSNPIFSVNGTNASKDSLVTFDQSGSYIFTVTITDAGGLFTTSSVSVAVDQTLTTIRVTPTTADLNENSTQAFSAIGYDQFDMALSVQPAFTWSLASGIGTVDASGLYSAGPGRGRGGAGGQWFGDGNGVRHRDQRRSHAGGDGGGHAIHRHRHNQRIERSRRRRWRRVQSHLHLDGRPFACRLQSDLQRQWQQLRQNLHRSLRRRRRLHVHRDHLRREQHRHQQSRRDGESDFEQHRRRSAQRQLQRERLAAIQRDGLRSIRGDSVEPAQLHLEPTGGSRQHRRVGLVHRAVRNGHGQRASGRRFGDGKRRHSREQRRTDGGFAGKRIAGSVRRCDRSERAGSRRRRRVQPDLHLDSNQQARRRESHFQRQHHQRRQGHAGYLQPGRRLRVHGHRYGRRRPQRHQQRERFGDGCNSELDSRSRCGAGSESTDRRIERRRHSLNAPCDGSQFPAQNHDSRFAFRADCGFIQTAHPAGTRGPTGHGPAARA